MPVSSLAVVASHPDLPLRTFEAGSVLLEEGPATNRIYVLATGEIEIAKGDVTVARVVDPGAIFGEISALLGHGHSATVRAATQVTAYEIEGATGFLDTSPELTRAVANLLAQRLIDAATSQLQAPCCALAQWTNCIWGSAGAVKWSPTRSSETIMLASSQ